MARKHEHCAGCELGHGTHDKSHERFTQLEEKVKFTLDGNTALQVLDALATQSEQAFQKMLEAVANEPFAFLDILHITLSK